MTWRETEGERYWKSITGTLTVRGSWNYILIFDKFDQKLSMNILLLTHSYPDINNFGQFKPVL